MVLPVAGLLPAAPALAGQQVATARLEENFRAEPNGVVVARVGSGTELAATRVRGRWVEAELEGWVWAESVRVTEREGRDLVVWVPQGENLRAEPQGTIRARLVSGALLDELGRRPGWVRVRRVGWIWLESVSLAAAAVADPGDPGGTDADPAPEPDPGEEPRDTAGPSGAVSGPGPARPGDEDLSVRGAVSVEGGLESGVLTVPAEGLAVLAGPDGDTLARARSGTDVQVLGRRGGWARVRVDGWVRLAPGASTGEDSTAAPVAVDPETVIREPDRYRGRLVAWVLHFVSLERAERARTDFYEGEPYLLTRPPGSTGTFVYVAVSPDGLAELQDLTPLETIEVLGRIRTGASAVTGSPVLDLVELRRPGTEPDPSEVRETRERHESVHRR